MVEMRARPMLRGMALVLLLQPCRADTGETMVVAWCTGDICNNACTDQNGDSQQGVVNNVYHDSDGECDDCEAGGFTTRAQGSDFCICAFGSDCADCGPREDTGYSSVSTMECPQGFPPSSPSPSRHGVRCCTTDGTSCESICSLGGSTACHGTGYYGIDPVSISCPAAATYDEAVQECEAQGRRLCTEHEVTSVALGGLDLCCGTGCGYDRHAGGYPAGGFWTSSECAPPSPPACLS